MIMLDAHDLTNPHDVERLRRSVAMLKPGVDVFTREQALTLLDTLGHVVRAGQESVLPDTYRRVANLKPGQWALDREDALELMSQLHLATTKLTTAEHEVEQARRRLKKAGPAGH